MAWEYLGCLIHGHPPDQCPITAKIKDHEWLRKKQPKLLQRTLQREKFLQDQGIQVTSMWECQFQKKKRTDPELKTFCKNRWTTCFKSWPDMCKIIEAVEKEEFFGALEVDLTVPKIWGQRTDLISIKSLPRLPPRNTLMR